MKMFSQKVSPVEILLIEDNEGDVYLTKKAFQEGKIINNLFVANDGEQALSILNNEPPYEDHIKPDLILLDINLPKLGGREVLERIKSDQKLRHIPVIILSSSEADKDIMDMYDLHANSYVTKPVDVNKFRQVATVIEDFWMGIVKLPPDKKT
jgi:CheY-like chemotaxis protein